MATGHSVPVWIIRLKLIQLPGPVSSLSVIMFRHPALTQVPGLIAVHTPPEKQPQLQNPGGDREIAGLPTEKGQSQIVGVAQIRRSVTSCSPCQT